MSPTPEQSNPNYKPQATTWFEKSYVIAIGINNYKSPIERLNNAVNDAVKIAKIFEKQGFEKTELLNEHATLNEIRKLLEKQKEIIGKNDRLVFYFAGHGIAFPNQVIFQSNSLKVASGETETKSRINNPQGYLIPQDGEQLKAETYLSMEEFISLLKDISCRHCLIILDCCYGGAIQWSLGTRQLLLGEKVFPSLLDTYIDSPAWQILTSAAEDQKASDGLFNVALKNNRDPDGESNSPFVSFMEEAIVKGAADIYPKDGIITITELSLYLRNKVEQSAIEAQRRQTPQLHTLPERHKRGEFVFLLEDFNTIKDKLPHDPDIKNDDNPYRGLESYTENHGQFFFGRDRLIEQLCKHVHTYPLTIVLGASGTGKSSLVNAGLVPLLKKSSSQKTEVLQSEISNIEIQQPNANLQIPQVEWSDPVIIRPGRLPIVTLDEALKKLKLDNISTKTKYLLVIDQFEEIETQCRDEDERQKFLNKLIDLLQNYQGKLHLVFTLRSDFQSKLRSNSKFINDIAQFANDWNSAKFPIEGMERQELREVIEKPVKEKAVFFTLDLKQGSPTTLVQKLVDEVAEMPGALPLVSFALYEMYRNFAQRYIKALKERNSIKREITWEDYPEGGVPESLARRANEEYKSLAQDTVSGERINLEPGGAETRKTILRCVMLRMIAVNGNETARKKVLKSELDYETENEQIQNVVDRFLEARLIVGGSDEQNNEYIEPAHDALILQWQELKGWYNENRDQVLLREELTRSSTDWDQNTRKGNDLLHRGEKLEKAEQYSKEQRFFLNKLESAYIKACRDLRNRQAKEQAESRSKTSLILFDSHQELDALVEAIRAGVITQREHLEESTSSLTTSILRKIVYGIKELNRLEEHQNWVISVSFSPNGEIIATGCRDKTVILWRNNGQKIKSLEGRFNSEGNIIATASNDKTVKLWNLDGQEISTLEGHSGYVKSVSFQPQSNVLVTTSDDQTVRLWQIDNPQIQKLEGHESFVHKVIFNQNCNIFATVSDDKTIKVWKFKNEEIYSVELLDTLEEYRKKNVTVNAISFHKNNNIVATATYDGNIHIWNLNDEKIQSPPLQILSNPHVAENIKEEDKYAVRCVCFNPDGDILASTGNDGIIKLWKFDSQKIQDKEFRILKSTLDDNRKIFNCVSFSPDGKFIAAGNRDHTTTLWNLNDDRLPIILRGHNGWIRSLSFNASGTIIATASDDKTVKLWNLHGQELQTLEGHNDEVHDISFNPDGTIIATASNDKTVKLWNLHGQELQTLAYGDRVDCVSFIPIRGSNTIIIGSRNNQLIVRELSSLNRWVELSNANLENLLEDAKQWIKNYSALGRNSWIEAYLKYTPGE